jgi:magnesium-transporting ATPase (P-type)
MSRNYTSSSPKRLHGVKRDCFNFYFTITIIIIIIIIITSCITTTTTSSSSNTVVVMVVVAVVMVAEAVAAVTAIVVHYVQFLKGNSCLCYFDLLVFVVYLCCICNWSSGC